MLPEGVAGSARRGVSGMAAMAAIDAALARAVDGARRLYTVTLHDVTGRVRSEHARKQSREALRDPSANLRSVRDAENPRIARALHDDLGQPLTALTMDVSTVAQAPDRFTNAGALPLQAA